MRCSDDQWIIMFRLFQMEKIRGRIDPRVLDVPYRPTILLVINMDGRFFFCFFFWSHGILLVMSRWRAGYLFCWIEELRFNYLTQPTELPACMQYTISRKMSGKNQSQEFPQTSTSKFFLKFTFVCGGNSTHWNFYPPDWFPYPDTLLYTGIELESAARI